MDKKQYKFKTNQVEISQLDLDPESPDLDQTAAGISQDLINDSESSKSSHDKYIENGIEKPTREIKMNFSKHPKKHE